MHAAYVLHTRAYRETSLLVDLITAEFGRVSLVARGAKRGKAKVSSLLQPFIPLQVSWYGNGELFTLKEVEVSGPSYRLLGKTAICGLYLNELLMRILPKWDPCMVTFANYQQALLHINDNPQEVLRRFEKELLTNLGYALQLTVDVETGEDIKADRHYMYDPALGLRPVKANHVGALQGANLMALHNDEYYPEMLADAKRLMRIVLSYYLGSKKLVTRELL